MKNWGQDIWDWLKLNSKYNKVFYYLLIAFVIYVFPIILADTHYIDDVDRSLAGRASWSKDGRPFTSFFNKIFFGGMPLADISPLLLIIALALLAYVLVVFSRKYFNEYSPFMTACGLFFCIANPFLLQNLSFKYDVLGMVISLCSAFILFSLPSDISNKKMFFISSIFSLTIFCTYQAALGAFLALGSWTIVLDYKKQKSWIIAVKQAGIKVLGCGLAAVIYQVLIIPFSVRNSGYAHSHSQIINVISSQGIHTFFSNLYTYFAMTSYIPKGILIIFLVLIIISAIMVIQKKTWKTSKESVRYDVIYYLILPFLLCISSVLILSLLNTPVFAPRVLISLCVFMTFMGMVLLKLTQYFSPIRYIFILSFICIMGLSYTYGNALKRQNEFDNFIAQQIAIKLVEIDGVENKDIYVYGQFSKAKEFELAGRKYKLITLLTPHPYGFTSSFIQHYSNDKLNFIKTKEDSTFEISGKNYQVREENNFFDIFDSKEKIIVNVK